MASITAWLVVVKLPFAQESFNATLCQCLGSEAASRATTNDSGMKVMALELGAGFSGDNFEFLGESGGGGLWVDGEMSGFRGGLSKSKEGFKGH